MRTWGDVQNEVLGLMFSNNTGGSKVTLSDQSVSEYVINMPDALNCAIKELSHIYPVKASVEIEVTNAFEQIDLKGFDGFICVSEDEVYYYNGDRLINTGNYDILGEDIFIPHEKGKYKIFYEKEPELVSEETNNEDEIDLPEDILSAAVYFMAHRLYLEDDSQIATMYYNIYESKKTELKEYYEERKASGGGFKQFNSVKGWI
ncbi:MAG: hypothetical protein IJE46_06665 [Clostridia bacterium]|nr:hypothetical protein [Clostridia bacterium]